MSDTDPDRDRDDRDELRLLASALRRHLEAFDRVGIHNLWTVPDRRAEPPPSEEPGDGPAQEIDDAFPAVEIRRAGPSLTVVREELGDCMRCKLSATRKNIVFGVGADNAQLLFIGEAPGAEEDRRGEPFVGAAGQLLDRMIVAMGWTRETVYIANVLKCRPPGNRDPQPDEVGSCLPFLHRQIEAIGPRLIVALGRPAAQAILSTSAPISALRGRFHEFRGIPVMPTFHPAFLLRSPDRKRDAWSDLRQVIDELGRLGVRSPHPARP